MRFYLSSLKQDIILPNKTAMDQDTQAAFAEHIAKGKVVRHFHKFGKQQWGYAKDLSSLGNILSLPEVLNELYAYVSSLRQAQLMYYKCAQFRIKDSNTFQHIN